MKDAREPLVGAGTPLEDLMAGDLPHWVGIALRGLPAPRDGKASSD